MKKCIFGLLAVFLMAVTVQAQDAKDLAKDSEKALGKFNLDQSANKAELTNAIQFADKAVEADENMARAWNARGMAYNAYATQWVAQRQLGQELLKDVPEVSMAGVRAYKSFLKGMETAEKNREQKDAIEGLQNVMGNLSNKGIIHFEDGAFGQAYACFEALLSTHETLTEMGENSGLQEEDYNRQLYITGLAALNAKNMDAAERYFTILYDMKYDEPAIYEALYQIRSEKTSPEEAYSILEEGKERYPDDVSMLFAEINHYLKLGQSEKLIDQLEKAIAAEPNNASLYSVMGNAYETIYQRAAEKGDTSEAEMNFNKALEYYDKAQEIDPESITAIYSAGALYYNKAAQLTQKMLELQDDYSKEGIAKYDAMREQVMQEFDNALPYFKKAEMINPNDMNTLIALKEIYAKKDDLEMSNVFKERLENLQSGVENEESYFKNN